MRSDVGDPMAILGGGVRRPKDSEKIVAACGYDIMRCLQEARTIPICPAAKHIFAVATLQVSDFENKCCPSDQERAKI